MTIEAVNFIENGIVFITESGSKLTIQSNRLKNETTTISQEKINEITSILLYNQGGRNEQNTG